MNTKWLSKAIKIKKVRMLGKSFDVYTSRFTVGDDNVGRINYSEQIIELSSVLSKEAAEETLLHEITHNIGYSLGLDLSEKQVTALSSGIYSILKENEEK